MHLEAIVLIVLWLGVASCTGSRNDQPHQAPEEALAPRTIQEVREAFTPEWMQLPEVVGAGIGLCDGEPCIRIFLRRPSPETERAIGERVDGYRIDFEVTGDFTPRSPADSVAREGGSPKAPTPT